MRGTTAIARAPFGEGRVICFSPHPEKTAGLEGMIARAIDAQREVPPTVAARTVAARTDAGPTVAAPTVESSAGV